jgi:hypothetical protein
MSEHNARGGSAVEEHTVALNPLTGFHLDDLPAAFQGRRLVNMTITRTKI